MPVPPFVAELRRHVGHEPLWLTGATAVILRDGAAGPEVLLVRRSDTGEWTLVSGIVDPGEHPATTAEREAQEEASVEVEVERLLWLGTTGPITYPNGDVASYVDHGFLARWVSGEATVGDDEATEVGWFPVGELPEGARPSVSGDVALALSGAPGCELRR